VWIVCSGRRERRPGWVRTGSCPPTHTPPPGQTAPSRSGSRLFQPFYHSPYLSIGRQCCGSTDPDPSFHFDADSDPSFQIDAEPDATFHFDVEPVASFQIDVDPDPDLVPRLSDANLRPLVFSGPKRFYFELPRLHSPLWAYVLHFDPPHFLNLDFIADPDTKPAFDLDADPDPAFHSDADPDPVSHNYGDPCGSEIGYLRNTAACHIIPSKFR
jgi:hypothetical protein